MSSIDVSLGEVAAALALVAVAAAVSLWRRADLEGDLAVAVVRSFVQLTAVGYVIQAIFDSDSLWLVVALLAVQVTVGTLTVQQSQPDADGPCRDINFDPTVLPDGIKVSDDPFPASRSSVYARSYDRRTAETADRRPDEARPPVAAAEDAPQKTAKKRK